MTRLWLAKIVCVIGLGLITHASIAQAGLEDILYEKGQLTKEEWIKAKADKEKTSNEQGKKLDDALTVKESLPKETQKNWYEKISLRGYAQVRYNRLFSTNYNLKCEQCDKSWGDNGGIFLRRLHAGGAAL